MTDGMPDTAERVAQDDIDAEWRFMRAANEEGLFDTNIPGRFQTELGKLAYAYGLGFRAALVYIRMERVAKGKAP